MNFAALLSQKSWIKDECMCINNQLRHMKVQEEKERREKYKSFKPLLQLPTQTIPWTQGPLKLDLQVSVYILFGKVSLIFQLLAGMLSLCCSRAQLVEKTPKYPYSPRSLHFKFLANIPRDTKFIEPGSINNSQALWEKQR